MTNVSSKKVKVSFFIFVVIFVVLGLIIYKELKKTELIIPKEIPVSIDEVDTDLTIDDIYKLNDGNADIIYKPGTTVLLTINGKFSEKPVLDEQDAVTALLSLRSLFRISEYSFCRYSESSNGFILQQLHEGIPVDGIGGFRIEVSKNGETCFIKGEFIDVSGVETEPLISYKDGLNFVDLVSGTYVKSAQLVICALDIENPVLCWKYKTDEENLIDGKIVYIDAMNGNVVYESSTVYY